MVSRLLSFAFAAGINVSLLAAQTGNAALEIPKTPAPAVTPAPSNKIPAEQRGDVLMARKMYREAIEAYREGPKKNAVILNKTGIAYHQMMQLDNAKKSYQAAIKVNKRYAEAINNLGTLYYARKNYGKAISYYKQALKLTPNSASVYSNLGTALFARKKYQEATEAYQMALKLDPEVFEHRGTYGVLLQERNVEERAKFHYYLAKTYAVSGQNERALQYLRMALEEGFKDKKKLQEDAEFAAIRETKEFQDLLALEPRVL
jgi:tetratricopeptide (TPR) repeat protein